MKIIYLLYAASIFLIAGCAAQMAPTTQIAGTAHAECLVCKMNFDLACIDVAVDTTTPRYMYNGQTYFFCSDECRDKFAKTPAKYAPK